MAHYYSFFQLFISNCSNSNFNFGYFTSSQLLSIVSENRGISAFTTYNYHTILLAFSSLICFFLIAEKKSKYIWGLIVCFLIYAFSIFTEGGRAGQLIFTLLLGCIACIILKKEERWTNWILIVCNYSVANGLVALSLVDNTSQIIQTELLA